MNTWTMLGAATLAVAFTMACSTAQAQELHRTDVTGDVVLRDPESNQVTVEPDWTNGDIVGLRVNHGPHRVKARLDFDELTRDVGAIFHDFEIRTPRRLYSAEVLTDENDWRGDTELWLPSGPKECAGLAHDVDYAEDFVRVSVPRNCLGAPRTGEDGKEPLHMTLTERRLRSS